MTKKLAILMFDSKGDRTGALRKKYGNEVDEFIVKDDILKFLNKLEENTAFYDNFVLIWHLSSSQYQKRQIGPGKVKLISDLLDDNGLSFKYKIGVSDSIMEYKSEPKFPSDWFSMICHWEKFDSVFNDGFLWGLKDIPLIKKREQINKTISLLLHLFLPLDIDMQALEMIQNDEEKVKKYLYGDKEIEGLFQSRKSDKHYRQKLYDLWHLLGEKGDWEPSDKAKKLTPLKDNPTLRHLAGLDNKDPEKSKIYEFLKSLDTGEDVAVDYLCEPFTNLDKEIKSFHNWYCSLAECLRGEHKLP